VRLRLPGRPDTRHGFRAAGGWKFGNTLDGCQAEYVLVPDALALIPPTA
jgi:threonine dehydrogenase-like Zn-dependent dehydrogenase